MLDMEGNGENNGASEAQQTVQRCVMRALVTGGTGFLGGALVRRLRDQGDTVTVLGRNSASGEPLQKAGIGFVWGDLADTEIVNRACAGQDVVFHCGANVAPWGRYQELFLTNVTGTKNVIQGCMEQQVARLVHVSTSSIYFGYQDRLQVGEYDRLPSKLVNAYVATKFRAEQAIERAHRDGLPVITIRPRAIFGPGDLRILPRVIGALEQGQLRVVGQGRNVQDLTYIDNVVDALLLCQRSPVTTLGKKYNITNGEPVLIWAKLKELCDRLGYEYPQRHLSFPIAFGAARLLEAIQILFQLKGEPPLTCYTVSLLAKSMTLDISAARRDLGYEPRITMDQGIDRFVDWWKTIHTGQGRL